MYKCRQQGWPEECAKLDEYLGGAYGSYESDTRQTSSGAQGAASHKNEQFGIVPVGPLSAH